jgi:hypothetical protein
MVLNIGDECFGSVVKEESLRTPNLFNRIFRLKEVKYQKYYYGEMVHNVRILQFIALALSFVSWFLVIFVHLILGATPLSKFELNIMNSDLELQFDLSQSEITTRIISLQSQYLIFYPYCIKIVMDCVVIFHNLYV